MITKQVVHLSFAAAMEQKVDTHGRVYYVDHITRTTTRKRPQTPLAEED